MTASDLPGTRTFGRILECTFECPHCGRLTIITRGIRPPTYDRRTGRFVCPVCLHVYGLGLIIYPLTTAGYRHQHMPPSDWIPTPREALALRQLRVAIVPTKRQPPDAPRNVVLPPCRCQLDGRLVLVHPACPVHSAAAKAIKGDPDQRG